MAAILSSTEPSVSHRNLPPILKLGVLNWKQTIQISGSCKLFKHILAHGRNYLVRETKRELRIFELADYELKCSVGGLYYMENKAKLTLLNNIAHGISFSVIIFR